MIDRPRRGLRPGAILRAASCFALLGAAGCVSYKPVPPLGDEDRAELAVLAQRLAAERVCVVPADERARSAAEDVASAVRRAGARIDERTPSLTIEVHEPWSSFEEPMLTVLTLGLFPTHGRGWRQDHWRLVAEDGRQTAGDVESESPFWFGWLVAPVALLPGWELTTTWGDGQERERRSEARRESLALGIARSVVRFRDAERAARPEE